MGGGWCEVDAAGEVFLEQMVVGHLRALVPRQGLPGQRRPPGEDREHGHAKLLGAVPIGQVHQAQVAGAPVDQGADRRAAGPADDQVALPVADPSAFLDHGRPLMQQPARRDKARRARHRAAPAFAQWPPGAELLGQCPAQAAFSAVVEGLVDGLVAQVPLRPVRIGFPEMRGDLRRTPLVLELVLDDLAQLWLPSQQQPARPPRSLAGAGVGQVAIVETASVWPEMAAELSTDRRRRPALPTGDLGDPEPSFAQGGDPLSFQQAQVPARAGRLGQPSGGRPPFSARHR